MIDPTKSMMRAGCPHASSYNPVAASSNGTVGKALYLARAIQARVSATTKAVHTSRQKGQAQSRPILFRLRQRIRVPRQRVIHRTMLRLRTSLRRLRDWGRTNVRKRLAADGLNLVMADREVTEAILATLAQTYPLMMKDWVTGTLFVRANRRMRLSMAKRIPSVHR